MTTIRVTRVLPAPPAAVFRALTDARRIAAWSGQSARIGKKPGACFEMFDGWATGRVVVYRPPSRFAHTWRVDEWKREYGDSLVEWRLSRAPLGTRVEVRHSLLPTAKEARDHRGGWVEYVLEPLGEWLKKKR